jgi:hypothetical protein
VWIEHLAAGSLVDQYTPYLMAERDVVTPIQVLCEVYRWTLRHVREQAAMEVVAHMEATTFAPAEVTTAVIRVTEQTSPVDLGRGVGRRLRRRHRSPHPHRELKRV